jgi:hypothetical protein
MCTRQEIQDIVSNESDKNNKLRNENLQNQLDKLKLEIFEKVDVSIRNRIEHITTSPETEKELNKIHITCATRGQDIKTMDEKIDLLTKKIDILNNGLNKSVSWSVFWSIIVLLVALFSGVIGYHSSKMAKVEEKVTNNTTNGAVLKNQNEQAIAQNNMILQELREIRGKIK